MEPKRLSPHLRFSIVLGRGGVDLLKDPKSFFNRTFKKIKINRNVLFKHVVFFVFTFFRDEHCLLVFFVEVAIIVWGVTGDSGSFYLSLPFFRISSLVICRKSLNHGGPLVGCWSWPHFKMVTQPSLHLASYKLPFREMHPEVLLVISTFLA